MTHTDTAVLKYLKRTGCRRMHPRAALCDMDGTLYDSMPRHAEAWHAMMLSQGIDVPIEKFFEYEGRTGANTIDILMRKYRNRPATTEECVELYKVKSANFKHFQEAEGIRVMPGAVSLVHQFEAAGMRPVLVTGSGQGSLINRLDVDYAGSFAADMRVTSRDVVNGKPNPEPYLKGLAKAGVAANEAIVLENAPLGVESGFRAGIFTIAVSTGPIPLEKLEHAGADIVYKSMIEAAEDFPNLLHSILTVENTD